MEAKITIPISTARSLYLDLMEKAIANTIYQDPDTKPGKDGTYSEADREEGRDWPRTAHTMIGVKRLHSLRLLAERVISDGVPGDFIETGVWRGGACVMMRAVCAAYADKSRKIICADSFEGPPPPDPDRFPADIGDAHHTLDSLSVDQEQVQKAFEAYDLLDDQVEFLKGWFKDTLPGLDRSFSIVRLDGGMYESTIQAIETLYPRLSVGGYLIVDDYGAVPACQKAICHYRQKHGISDTIHKIDWTGVWWQKTY